MPLLLSLVSDCIFWVRRIQTPTELKWKTALCGNFSFSLTVEYCIICLQAMFEWNCIQYPRYWHWSPNLSSKYEWMDKIQPTRWIFEENSTSVGSFDLPALLCTRGWILLFLGGRGMLGGWSLNSTPKTTRLGSSGFLTLSNKPSEFSSERPRARGKCALCDCKAKTTTVVDDGICQEYYYFCDGTITHTYKWVS